MLLGTFSHRRMRFAGRVGRGELRTQQRINRPGVMNACERGHRAAIAGLAAVIGLGVLLVGTAPLRAGIVPLGPAVQANTTFGGDFVRIVALPDAGFIVLWNTVGRRFDAEGNPDGPEFGLENVGYIITADAATTNGTLVLTWDEFPERWFVGRFTDHGVPVGDPVSINGLVSDPDFSVNDATVAATPSGGFVVAWEEAGFIRAQRFDDNNGLVGSAFDVAREDMIGVSLGGIASDTLGGLVATWWDEFSLAGFATWARQFDAQNNPLGERISVVQPGGIQELFARPEVCVDERGDFIVAWEDEEHPIEFRRYGAHANPLIPRLSTAIGGTSDLPLACLSQGRFVVAGLASPRAAASVIAARLTSRAALLAKSYYRRCHLAPAQ